MMRRVVASAVWNALYHEGELSKAHRIVAYAKSLLARTGFDFTLEEALADYNEYEEDDPTSPADWVKKVVGDAAHGVEYHERELARAHAEIAMSKAMLLRGNYAELSFTEIAENTEKEFNSVESAKS